MTRYLLMRTPLFLFFIVFTVCVFSGCKNAKCHYHNEQACGQLKGNVKKVTDTVYAYVNADSLPLLQIVEYHFDSLNRMTEESVRFYNPGISDTSDETSTSLSRTQISKHRYDRNGRKVETHVKSCTYIEDSIFTTQMFMRLQQLEDNHEVWEMSLSDSQKGDSVTYALDKYYTNDTISVSTVDRETEKISKTVLVFDEGKKMIEKRETDEEGNLTWVLYEYDKNDQLSGIRQKPLPELDDIFVTTYRHDEFDNEGNWLKRYEYDEKHGLINIIHRRIEYRN